MLSVGGTVVHIWWYFWLLKRFHLNLKFIGCTFHCLNSIFLFTWKKDSACRLTSKCVLFTRKISKSFYILGKKEKKVIPILPFWFLNAKSSMKTLEKAATTNAMGCKPSLYAEARSCLAECACNCIKSRCLFQSYTGVLGGSHNVLRIHLETLYSKPLKN